MDVKRGRARQLASGAMLMRTPTRWARPKLVRPPAGEWLTTGVHPSQPTVVTPTVTPSEIDPNSFHAKLLKLLARPKGFEPLTPRFVVWCSIQLSYGRPSTDAPC